MEGGGKGDCCECEVNPATPVYGDKPGFKILVYYSTTNTHKLHRVVISLTLKEFNLKKKTLSDQTHNSYFPP